jgi:allophanate hydrolase
VAADPIAVNARLGRYSTFGNLLDLCGYSVPAGEADGGCFGVTLLAPAFHDQVVADLAARFSGEPGEHVDGRGLPLLVVGAHMSGEPLNGELTGRGGRLLRAVRTAAEYRLYVLATEPPKPGLVRAESGVSIAGELWALPPAGLASLLAELPSPMALGRVALEDGSEVTGFLCEPAALAGAREVTAFGGWRPYLASQSGGALADAVAGDRAAAPRAG